MTNPEASGIGLSKFLPVRRKRLWIRKLVES
jgi:hypothetical protein